MPHWNETTIAPQAKTILKNLEEKGRGAPPIRSIPINILREKLHAFWSSVGPPYEKVSDVKQTKISGSKREIELRIYEPERLSEFKSAIIFFHGGAHCVLNFDTYDAICRILSNKTGSTLISVNYSLAPEHPFPAGPEDCIDATKWVFENTLTLGIDEKNIALVGDSAGGNMALQVSIALRDEPKYQPKFQLLIYPNTDLSRSLPSHQTNDGILLDAENISFYYELYAAKNVKLDDPKISPLWHKDLSRLPQTEIITAEFDPVRDDGERLADRLRESGVPVTLKRYDGMVHGFVSMAGVLDKGREALIEICKSLTKAFSV